MKKYICIYLLPILLVGCMTVVATQDQEKSLEEIKSFPSMTKNDLYKKALNWVARTYNSANDVIQLKDPDAGQLICKGMGSFYSYLNERYFSYTMIIDIKDEKIRINFENIQSEMNGTAVGPDMNIQWDEVNAYFIKLKKDLFNDITKEKIDNW